MAYNTPPTKAVGNPFTAAEWNTYIRDNFAASFPDLASAKGDIPVATGANVIQALPVGTDYQVIEALASQPTGLRWAGYPPNARLYRGTVQSIGDNVDTQITGFTIPSDYGGFLSGDTFVIPIAGMYAIEVSGYWALSAIANKIRQICVNIDSAKEWQTTTSDVNNVNIHQKLTAISFLSATSVIKMRVLQISGGALDFNNASLKITRLR